MEAVRSSHAEHRYAGGMLSIVAESVIDHQLAGGTASQLNIGMSYRQAQA